MQKNVVVMMLALFAVVWMSAPLSVLVATNGEEILFVWGISASEEFSVGYVHSVNNSPVLDVFGWDESDGKLELNRSYFETMGAGMPHPSDFPGSELVSDGGMFALRGIYKSMSGLSILVHTYSAQHVILGEQRAELAELAPDGASVRLYIDKAPRFMSWIR